MHVHQLITDMQSLFIKDSANSTKSFIKPVEKIPFVKTD